jgi:GGDEF domain-containing protein
MRKRPQHEAVVRQSDRGPQRPVYRPAETPLPEPPKAAADGTCRRPKLPLLAAIIDIGHFKAVNDIHGRSIGAMCFCAFGAGRAGARDRARRRSGGAPGCAAVPAATAKNLQGVDAEDAVELLCASLHRHLWSQWVAGSSCTVSIGFGHPAVSRRHAALAEALRRRAVPRQKPTT